MVQVGNPCPECGSGTSITRTKSNGNYRRCHICSWREEIFE